MSLRGCIEVVSEAGDVSGWLVHDEHPEAELFIDVYREDQQVLTIRPSFDRPDIGRRAGFQLSLGQKLHPIDLFLDRIVVLGRSSALDESVRIYSIDSVAEDAARRFANVVSVTPNQYFRKILAEVMDPQPVEASARTVAPDHDLTTIRNIISDLVPKHGSLAGGAPLHVPLGHVSADGTTLVGMEGYLFLVGGGNALINQYLQGPGNEWVADVSHRWFDVILRRAHHFKSTRARFLQLIIPEKLGTCRDLFPFEIPEQSPFIGALEERIRENSDAAACYVSGMQILNAVEPRTAFPRTDSHLSFLGNFAILRELVRRMGLIPPEDLAPELPMQRIFGDLSERFCGVHLFEEIPVAPSSYRDDLDQGVELIESFNPENAHIGIRYVWRNRNAVHKLKVVAFGNSFFERGGDSRGLSWWCARLFSEFHFIWHPNVDHAYVAEHDPDWVIAQTIERFLPTVADH